MTAATDFEVAAGDMHGLPTNEHHFNVKWRGGPVWFSLARKGNGMSIHFAAEKQALRKLESAVECFVGWVFANFDWCRMILAIIGKRSVVKLAKRCGFRPVIERNGKVYMARARKWDL